RPPSEWPLFRGRRLLLVYAALVASGILIALLSMWNGWMMAMIAGITLALLALIRLVEPSLPDEWRRRRRLVRVLVVAFAVTWVLTLAWMPLGIGRAFIPNLLFVGGLVGGLIGLFTIFERSYGRILRWTL